MKNTFTYERSLHMAMFIWFFMLKIPRASFECVLRYSRWRDISSYVGKFRCWILQTWVTSFHHSCEPRSAATQKADDKKPNCRLADILFPIYFEDFTKRYFLRWHSSETSKFLTARTFSLAWSLDCISQLWPFLISCHVRTTTLDTSLIFSFGNILSTV